VRKEREPHRCDLDALAESLVVRAVMGVVNGRTRAWLPQSLRDVDPARIEAATMRLIAAAVVAREGGACSVGGP
jgi:hypothetical protein